MKKAIFKDRSVVFLSGILPESQYQLILDRSSQCVQFAADALQKSIINGLAQHISDLTVINLPFIGSWPKRYKSWLSSESIDEIVSTGDSAYRLINKRFVNIQGLKLFDRYIRAKNAIIEHCERNKDKDIYLIIYSVHTPFIKAAVDVKKRFKNLRIVLVVPDLPEYMGGSNKGLYKIIRDYNKSTLDGLYDQIDGFVLLTEYMKDRLIKQNQPYVVVEGIFNPNDETKDVMQSDVRGNKVIMYSGTLSRRYNVMDLVEAVLSIDRHDFVLEIYGDGDTRKEIEEISRNDARVKYCGQRSRDFILQRQRQADLLVNPRVPTGEYTKYSFPSKTMEYLASGTPTLLYQLPGIPPEYYNYCYSIPKNSNETLADRITNILNQDTEKLRELGDSARRFVFNYKNPKKQTERIVALIDMLRNK